MDSRVIGRKLRYLRAVRGLEQSDVERATGISQSQLSKLERGAITRPSIEPLATLAHYYGITTDSLLGFEQLPKDSPERIREQAEARIVQQAIEAIRKLISPPPPDEEEEKQAQSHFNTDYSEIGWLPQPNEIR